MLMQLRIRYDAQCCSTTHYLHILCIFFPLKNKSQLFFFYFICLAFIQCCRKWTGSVSLLFQGQCLFIYYNICKCILSNPNWQLQNSFFGSNTFYSEWTEFIHFPLFHLITPLSFPQCIFTKPLLQTTQHFLGCLSKTCIIYCRLVQLREEHVLKWKCRNP